MVLTWGMVLRAIVLRPVHALGRILVALGTTLLALGCYHSGAGHAVVTLRPSVIIDDTFTPEEQEGIGRGLDLWRDSGTGVAFAARTMPRDELLRVMGTATYPDTIYLVRDDGAAVQCVRGNPAHGVTDGDLATTWREIPDYGIEVICLDAPFIAAHSAWAVTVAHEVGHALGLAHDEVRPSLMAPTLDQGSKVVECTDKRQLARVWGLSAVECR